MIQKLEQLFKEFENSLTNTTEQADVLNLKSKYLGKKGHISEVLKSLKDATAEEKKELGPKANFIKDQIQELTNKNGRCR